jgi:hypothetical protein
MWLKLNISASKKTTLASSNNNLTLVHNTDMRKNFLGFGSSSSTKKKTFGLCTQKLMPNIGLISLA